MNKLTHLTTDDLILFIDRELGKTATAFAEQHLLHCIDCGHRLKALKSGSDAYRRYHDQVLKPNLPVPASGWLPLSDTLAPNQRMHWGLWWAAAAFAGALVLVFLYLPMRTEASAQEVLDKAASLKPTRGEILVTTGKHRLTRPGVLEAGASEARFQHVQALFVRANYSWANPLSARSFVDWRRQLPEKQDSVTAVREDGGRQFYRVRTRTDSGILHSASLTLEAVTYHPTNASFQFQGEDPIDIYEQSSLSPNKPQETQAVVPVHHPRVTETVAGPDDELRVFAALDAIGADAEEPIEVKLDPGHHAVVVSGLGMPPDRRKQIETALASLPNTIVRFGSNQPTRNDVEVAASPDAGVQTDTSQFRQKLQDLAGGIRQLQTITDESTEISNTLFAQSHSLLILAQEFPPPVEASLSPASASTLLVLRQRRVGAMSYALRRLRDELKPLLTEDVRTGEASRNVSWQTTTASLYKATRNLDRVVSRLLAGSYDEQTGELMLKQLPDDISQIETLVHADGQ